MKRIIQIICVLAIAVPALGQNVSINTDGSPGHPSAMLDVSSTSSGILIPRLSASQREAISNPAEGLLVYELESQSFWYYSSGWNELGSGSAPLLVLQGQELSVQGGNSVILPQPVRIADADQDTRVEVEFLQDEDRVSFFIGNEFSPAWVFDSKRLQFFGSQGNLMIGNAAGASQSFGQFNTLIGEEVAINLGIASYNTHLGYRAGHLSSGSSNTLIGTEAGLNLTTGSDNVLIGDFVASDALGAGQNVVIGAQAGQLLTTGTGNVIIGYKAGLSANTNNRLAIGYDNLNPPLIYGEFDNEMVLMNGDLVVRDVLVLGDAETSTAGALRYHNGTFEGFDGTTWASISSSGFEYDEVPGIIRPVDSYLSAGFVIGASSFNDDGTSAVHNRLQFNKTTGAFRAGGAFETQWDDSQSGQYSFASGLNNISSGLASFSAGQSCEATGTNGVALGQGTRASSLASVSIGRYNIGFANSPGSFNVNDAILEVGIGTSSLRSNALTVFKSGKVVVGGGSALTAATGGEYKLVVEGALLCEEIKVQDSGNWPDFVFQPEYELLELEELKSLVAENGHLPGVPAAAEINGNGIEVGQMVEVLLRKIEELHLYIFDLESRIKTLEK